MRFSLFQNIENYYLLDNVYFNNSTLNIYEESIIIFKHYFFITIMAEKDQIQESALLPDMSDAEEARKAFIASEIFNRKYE